MREFDRHSNAAGGSRDRRTRLLEGSRDRLHRDVREQREGDVIIDGRKLKLRSPDGTYWSVQVDNTGALSTTNEGTSLL